MSKRNPLGKGLEALLPQSGCELDSEGQYFNCPIDSINPNPMQPRKEFDSSSLDELSESIKEKGVIQPLIVRAIDNGNEGFELIAGERRWRASRLAGLDEVPVVVKDVSSNEMLELALIENIQRHDLNPLEEAMAYDRLIKEFGLTQKETAVRVGRERSSVANTLRLLQLPDFAKKDIISGILTVGHARVLLGLHGDETELKSFRDKVVSRSLSVRQTEDLAKDLRNRELQSAEKRRKISAQIPRAKCRQISSTLFSYLGNKSKVVQKGIKGKLEIEYSSPDDLERVMQLIIKG